MVLPEIILDIVGKIQDGLHFCKVKLYIDIIFDRMDAKA